MKNDTSSQRLSVLILALAALVGLVGTLAATSACRSTVPPGVQFKDSEITAKVKAKLATDGDINPFNIDVDTNEGVVTLQGRVAKEEARTKAEDHARHTEGVKRVIDLIKVGDRT